MIIAVAQRHIDKGVKGSPYCDPICLAIKETLINMGYDIFPSVAISKKTLFFGGRTIPIPPEMLKFIVAFDAGETVLPRPFHIPIIYEVLAELEEKQ